jgi:hypothetical protein
MRTLLLSAAVAALAALPAGAVEQKAIDRAIDKGVAALRKMQQSDGAWKHEKIGATALAGLALLECGAARDDKAVIAAATRVRIAALTMTDTYSLSLSILFLDKLDAANDTPLIESMLVRLLAGMTNGGWSYECPPIAEAEARRLAAEASGKRVLKGGRDLSKMPEKGKRKLTDLPREIQAQLVQIARGEVGGITGLAKIAHDLGGDNSNTQFGALALWVGRRYGLPVQGALLRVDERFRAQQYPDGSFGYMVAPPIAKMLPASIAKPEVMGPSASMTCAGLLGLAFGHGALLDVKKMKNPKAEESDVGKDAKIKAAFLALSAAVGEPTGWSGMGKPAGKIPPVFGKGFYFLWSLERVAVAYKLNVIGKKDWYQWGAEVLLAAQKPSGAWEGEYAACGADTCFALLFLKRADFTRDLAAALAGGKQLGDKVLTGVSSPKDKKPLPLDIGQKPPLDKAVESKKSDNPISRVETPRKSASQLAGDLVKSNEQARADLLQQLRDGKGSQYTQALAGVIARLDVAGRKQAREALTTRLVRMKPGTLREYLSDESTEIRRSAALAAGEKNSKMLVPELIGLLGDSEALVATAAHKALKKIAGRDFGPEVGASRAETTRSIRAWQAWWKLQPRE